MQDWALHCSCQAHATGWVRSWKTSTAQHLLGSADLMPFPTSKACGIFHIEPNLFPLQLYHWQQTFTRDDRGPLPCQKRTVAGRPEERATFFLLPQVGQSLLRSSVNVHAPLQNIHLVGHVNKNKNQVKTESFVAFLNTSKYFKRTIFVMGLITEVFL